MKRSFLKACRVGIFVLGAVVMSGKAAQSQDEMRLVVEMGKGIVLPGGGVVDTVFVADNAIADAIASESGEIYVYGRAVGETTLLASAADGAQSQYTVMVTPNIVELRRELGERFPGTNVSIKASRGSVLVSGVVGDEVQRQRLIQTIESDLPNLAVIDQLEVSSSNLVTLRVRLLEVDRTRADSFGIDWDATVASNGFFLGASDRGVIRLGARKDTTDSLNAALDVLTTSGIVTVAQETLLSTVVGKSAHFSVGGEIPVPNYISDQQDGGTGNYKLDYKFIGTDLSFTPVNAPGEKLRLEIESNISSAGTSATTVNGNTFPNLRSRSIRTSVELEDRNSFVIAGISRDETVLDLRNGRAPGLSRAVDALFGSDRRGKAEQELVIVVTPLLSADSGEQPSAPVLRSVSNLEHIISKPDGSFKSTKRLPKVIQLAGFRY